MKKEFQTPIIKILSIKDNDIVTSSITGDSYFENELPITPFGGTWESANLEN